MKYINNVLFMGGIISTGVGTIGLLAGNADVMLSVYLMSGGVITMAIGNILTELCEWWEEIRYGI